MPETRSKKELQDENEKLKRELYLFKNKQQVARNYCIVKEENEKLKEEIATLKEAKTC